MGGVERNFSGPEHVTDHTDDELGPMFSSSFDGRSRL